MTVSTILPTIKQLSDNKMKKNIANSMLYLQQDPTDDNDESDLYHVDFGSNLTKYP